MKRRLAALSAGFRPASETINWHEPIPVDTLWTTEEERWEAHCRALWAERDALVAEVGREGYIRWKTQQRRIRNQLLRYKRLTRLPRV